LLERFRICITGLNVHHLGQVSITLDSDWKEPLDSGNPSDVTAAERAMQFKLGWFAHPIYVNGDYPEEMKQRVAAKSEAEGLAQSRLPEFTAEEKLFIKGNRTVHFMRFVRTR
jgi:beta-glucosidase/6-phospho-beta-glucosidase/beta-galactosidase